MAMENGTRARVLSQTLVHGNSKNKKKLNKQLDEEGKQKSNGWSEDITKYTVGVPICYALGLAFGGYNISPPRARYSLKEWIN